MDAKGKAKPRWRLAEAPAGPDFPGLPPVVSRLLRIRGVADAEGAARFLNPDWERDIHDPFLFRDMRAACALAFETVGKGEPVVVYGDYDADGVTGSVLLVSVLRDLADLCGTDPASVRSYIPHREREGYGIQEPAVRQLLSEGIRLMVSVDCGIGSAKEIALAKAGGAEAIVIDHHQPPAAVPDCLTIHPGAPGEDYPFKSLAAVGVAFKFASGLIAYARERGAAFPPGYEKWLLDLVAIATVTDIVPLLGENRALERFGLIVLNKTRRPGLAKLMDISGLRPGGVDTRAVGFGIGPRINAASRLEHASIAFDCLMAKDAEEAAVLANRLNGVNLERQRLTEQMTKDAAFRIGGNPNAPVHILAGEGWPAGVVGIIAGRLVNLTGRPCFVFGADGDRFVGSGRSIPEFDIMAAIESARDCLARYGGHHQACGLTIEGRESFDRFRVKLTEYAAAALRGADLRPVISLEAEIGTAEIDWSLIRHLDMLEPFGEANPKPQFLMRNLKVSSLACVGKDSRHVRIGLKGDSPKEIKAIGFGLAEAAMAFPPGSLIDAAVELGTNEWNGRKEIQVRLLDIRPAAGQVS